MNVCPECGLPFEKELSMEGDVYCDYCGWAGATSNTLFTSSADFGDDELARLRKVFIYLAKQLSPQIMSKLIEEDFFKRDLNDVPKMIPVLSATTRAMFSALVTALCEQRAKESLNVAPQVRPQA